MNLLESSVFYLTSSVAVVSALVVVTSRRPTYGVLALALAMIAQAVLFILLRAYFVAVIQVLIYAGAILVLFLFVVMLLGVGMRDVEKKIPAADRLIPFLIAFTLLLELGIVMTTRAMPGSLRTNVLGTVEAIGEALFTSYLLPFELISGILLIGIFGVVGLAQRNPKR